VYRKQRAEHCELQTLHKLTHISLVICSWIFDTINNFDLRQQFYSTNSQCHFHITDSESSKYS